MEINKENLSLEDKNRFVQFQIWRDCPVGCEFCYNKNITPTVSKIENLKWIESLIENEPIVNEYNEIGLIGGETFSKELSDRSVREEFYGLIQLIISKMKEGKVEKLYLTTSLIFKDNWNLLEVLEKFKEENLENKILICTSYDTKYRFKNENSLKFWENNILEIHRQYTKVPIHVETIITQDFCEKVLRGEFSITHFREKYDVHVDYIEASINDNSKTLEEFNRKLPGFLPERKTFFRFLDFVRLNNLVDWDSFFNYNLHSDLMFIEHKGERLVFDGRRKGNERLLKWYATERLGRSLYTACYSDNYRSILEDVKAYKELHGLGFK